MTINTQVPWVIYQADGLQTTFPYDFVLTQASDLCVYWQDMLLPPGGYTVTGVAQPEGGNVVFPQPLPAGELLLRRATPQNQLTDYVEGDAFPAESHEQGLDRLTVLVQDVNERLSRVSTLGVTTGTAHRHLVLPDPVPNTVLGWDAAGHEWTLYPPSATQIQVDPVSGIGWGKNTIALTPAAGTEQVSGMVFPAGVLAIALSAWIATSLGTSQGLQQVGLGTSEQPDCWGLLPGLTAGTETTAGLFQGYGGQPQLQSGLVTLTAYGGRFDGTGTIYLTGHFTTFRAAQTLGYSFTAGAPESNAPLPVATRDQAGIVELSTAQEDLDGLRDDVTITPQGLQAKLATLPMLTTGTPLSIARYRSDGLGVEGTTVTIDASGNLGVGVAAPAAALHVLKPTAGLRFERTAGAGQYSSLSDSSNILELRKIGTNATTLMDFNITTDGTQAATLRIFRGTTTTGTRSMILYRGDGTNVSTHVFGLGGDKSSLQLDGGNLGVGTQMASGTLGSGASYQKLTVSGSTLYVGASSTVERPMGGVSSSWVDNIDATRKARLTLTAYDATAGREGLRIEASGTAPLLGFFGVNAVARPTVPAAATDAATTQTLANSLRTALVNLGLCV